MCVVEQDGGGASQAQGVALQRDKDSAKLISFRAQKQLETQPEAVQDQNWKCFRKQPGSSTFVLYWTAGDFCMKISISEISFIMETTLWRREKT